MTDLALSTLDIRVPPARDYHYLNSALTDISP